MKRNRHFYCLICFRHFRHSLMVRSRNPVTLNGALAHELRQRYLYSTSLYVSRWSALTVERDARWTVSVRSICQNLIAIRAEFKETNNAVSCKRWCYIHHAQLQLWEKRGLVKHCADPLISIPEHLWCKTAKYALCSVSTLIKAGQVSVFTPTYCWIKVPQSNISTHFFPLQHIKSRKILSQCNS